jgi:hypothetical protein
MRNREPFRVLRLGLALLLSFAGCERKPPDCAAIRDMKECERTKGCAVSSIWVMGLPDAKPPPQHHQYECVVKQP